MRVVDEHVDGERAGDALTLLRHATADRHRAHLRIEACFLQAVSAAAACRAEIQIHATGGVGRVLRVPELAATGADYVSAGALTHSAPAVDISFEIEPI